MKKSGNIGKALRHPPVPRVSRPRPIDHESAARLYLKIVGIFGEKRGYIKTAAQVIGVNYDNLLKMLKGKRPIPAWIFELLASIEARSSIPVRVPHSENPEEDGIAAVSPVLHDLEIRANRSGWSHGEVFFSILNWSIRRIAETLGDEAAEKIFKSALKNYRKNAGSSKKPLA